MLGTFFEVKKNDGFLTKIAMQIDRDMYSVNKSTCILTALSYQLYIYIYISSSSSSSSYRLYQHFFQGYLIKILEYAYL